MQLHTNRDNTGTRHSEFALSRLSAAPLQSLWCLAAVSAILAVGCGSSGPVVSDTNGVIPPTQPPVDRPSASIDVTFTIDAAATYPISRYIYGGNFISEPSVYGGATPPAELTLNRMGGNRLSAYNWETNFSNAGADYRFQNDRYLSTSTSPGEAVKTRATPSFSRNQAFMATIPMLNYVAADDCECNVGTSEADRASRLATHFRISRAFKGSPLTASPVNNDAYVNQDEFVHWFETTFPGRASHPTAPVFFSLDNEPDIWHATHKQVQSDVNDNPNTPRYQTYTGLADTSISYARAVKSVLPSAVVFGPAVATYAGIATGGRYPSPDPVFGTQNFLNVYLDRMRAAESTFGRRMLDVLDVHWYPAIGRRGEEINNDTAQQDSAMVWARVQGPRSLWDPTFNENSWVSGVTAGPIRLIPRLKEQIAAHYPGTKLAITEYYYGRGGDISGGIAQADVLGIFGREGVFAAAFWPQANIWATPYGGDGKKAYAYVFGAFRMFRNYDGDGGSFGDTGLRAATSDNAASSVYASRNAAGQIVIIAINKTTATKSARITVAGAAALTAARVFTMTSASATPAKQADLPIGAGNALDYAMPAMSVSTLVLVP
jgi:Glycoside hydrolase family 44